MSDFSIGIIGGTGGIGQWFADFLVREGYAVHVAGRKTGLPAAELAALCRIIVVAVPIAATIAVIGKVGPHLSADSLLMDLTSLKEESVRAMLAATSAEVIGCHPLFGPDVSSLHDNNIILCPGRGESWLSFLSGLFEARGARVTITSPAEHDRMMSLIQGLTHFNTILMELALRDSDRKQSELEPFSTPIFRAKQALGARVFGANADLYAAILTKNPHIMQVIECYEKNLSLVKGLIAERNTVALAELLRK
ncbi:MAG: prephenate dehydrogenase/arogenate dehydrogenase family protein [Syntrophales bacterium]